MKRILAMIDSSVYAESVVDHAVWLAGGSPASIDVVHMMDPLDPAAVSVGMAGLTVGGPGIVSGTGTYSAEKLAELTTEAQILVDGMTDRIAGSGAATISGRVIVGKLRETFSTLQQDSDLVVVGKRGETADFIGLTLGSKLHTILHPARVPVLIVPRTFRPIAGCMLAMGDDAELVPGVDRLTVENLLPALPCEIIHVGPADKLVEADIEAATRLLSERGFDVGTTVLPGEPIRVMAERLARGETQLVAVGRFSRSRILPKLFGEGVASGVAKASQGPILVLRREGP